jgi:hypothetical protein
MDQKRNRRKMPSWSSRTLSKSVYQHLGQTPTAISLDKYDLGLAKNFTHRIHLKDDQPIFRKQFNLPEAHTQFIEQSLDEWLKLGVVRQSNSSYISPIFCVPKKQGQGLRIVQDFRLLNQHSHID